MIDDAETPRADLTVAQIFLALAGLEIFTGLLIKDGVASGKLSDDALVEMRDRVIVHFKNMNPARLPIELDAEMMGKGVDYLEKSLHRAFANGGKGNL